MLQAASALKGFALEASDGRLGTVSDFLFSDETWKIRWLVVDTGHWLTGRKVLIHPSAIGQADYNVQELPVALTKAQVEGSPDILQHRPVSRQMENDLYGYYGWDPVWAGGFYGAGAMGSPLAPSPYLSPYLRDTALLERPDVGVQEDHEDPHLRSLTAITGYRVHASDGEIGHIENMLIDSSTWTIRNLIVDTRNWWPGKHVLLSPFAVSEVSWWQHEMRFNITRDQVRSSPPWDPLALVDQTYEQRLHSHYGWLA
jgi:hypothetical protein